MQLSISKKSPDAVLEVTFLMACFFQSLTDDDEHLELMLSDLVSELDQEETCLERIEGRPAAVRHPGRGLSILQRRGRYGLPREELQLGGRAGAEGLQQVARK
jgi:hypothetical protein